VAYVSGRTVRVVAGDGTGDRLIGPGVAAEWRPGASQVTAVAGQKAFGGPNVLAVARADGRVTALDVDSRVPLWSSRAVTGRPRALSWSGDGAHVMVATAKEVAVLYQRGEVTQRTRIPARTTLTSAAYAPIGLRIAMVRRRPGVSELVLLENGHERLLFAGAGRLGAVTWSPDGRWLLVPWPTADQFLFVRTTGSPRVEAAQGVAGEFDPRAAAAPAGNPRPVGWK
jgi:hypothetical protein